MKHIVVDGFELKQKDIQLLLNELKEERILSLDDLAKYLKDHSYVKDHERKFHLLIAKYPNKRNFAIPFDE